MTSSTVERPEMGLTHGDFYRIFPRLVDDARRADIALESHVEWADGRQLTVHVSPEMIRRIALLRLPYVNIRFSFQGFTAAERDHFMGRFDRAFHKGGG